MLTINKSITRSLYNDLQINYSCSQSDWQTSIDFSQLGGSYRLDVCVQFVSVLRLATTLDSKREMSIVRCNCYQTAYNDLYNGCSSLNRTQRQAMPIVLYYPQKANKEATGIVLPK